MRNPNEILELFKNIENQIDTDDLIYKKNNVWPVFRLRLGFDTLYNRTIPKFRKLPKESKLSFVYHVPYLVIKICFYFIKFLIKLPLIKNKNWFWAFEEIVFTDRVDSKKYSRYIDPYFEFFHENKLSAQRITFRTLECSPCTGNKFYHQSSIFDLRSLQKLYYCFQKLRRYTGSYKKDILLAKELVMKVSQPMKGVDKKCLSLSYYNFFEEVRLYDFCFSLIFKFYKPRNILFECYYSEMKMGLISAAGKNKINTIDIQHGVVEDFMYLPFNGDKRRQNLLPKYIWCWSINDVNTLISFNANGERLIPVKLGNLWFKKINRMDGIIPENYLRKKETSMKMILITLQHQIGYQKIFFDIISELPNDWTFLIRFHPLMTQVEKEEYIKVLSEYKNVDFECNYVLDLFQCFRLADINLTHSSTTAIEALNFNLQSILVDKIGFEYYQNLVNKNILHFNVDPKEIMNIIIETDYIDFTKKFTEYMIDIENVMLLNKLKVVLN